MVIELESALAKVVQEIDIEPAGSVEFVERAHAAKPFAAAQFHYDSWLFVAGGEMEAGLGVVIDHATRGSERPGADVDYARMGVEVGEIEIEPVFRAALAGRAHV